MKNSSRIISVFLTIAMIVSLASVMVMTSSAASKQVKFDFTTDIEDFSEWASSYSEHEVSNDEAKVVFTSANRQGATITDMPVIRNKATDNAEIICTINGNKVITGVALECAQWNTKTQTIVLNTSADGTNFTQTDIKSSDFSLSSDNIGEGVIAVKFTFTDAGNQIGIRSLTLTYEDDSSAPTCEHTYTETVTTPATCTEDGVKTLTCSKCGITATQKVPATGHNIANGICQNCGIKTLSKVDVSELKNNGKYVITIGGYAITNEAGTKGIKGTAAAGDSIVGSADYLVLSYVEAEIGQFYLVSEDGKYLTSGETGSLTTLEDSASDLALWEMVVVDGTNMISSVNALYTSGTSSKKQALEYYNGQIYTYGYTETYTSMGAYEACFYSVGSNADEYEVSELKFNSAAVVFEDSLSIKFYTLKSIFEGYDSFYAKVLMNGNEYILDGEENGDYYQFIFNNINAKEMSDIFTITIYAEKSEGNSLMICYGADKEYSLREYAMNRLNESSDDKFKTLLVDVLTYGAQAQKYFGYNTDDLATALLSDEQLSYGTSKTPWIYSDYMYTNRENETVKLGANLVFESTLNMNILINATNYTGDISGLTLNVSYTSTVTGEDVDVSIAVGDLTLNGMYYVYKLDKFTAREFGTVVTVNVCDEDGKAVSGTLCYSMATYVCNKVHSGSVIVDLSIATIKYANSATDYFNSKNQ